MLQIGAVCGTRHESAGASTLRGRLVAIDLIAALAEGVTRRFVVVAFDCDDLVTRGRYVRFAFRVLVAPDCFTCGAGGRGGGGGGGGAHAGADDWYVLEADSGMNIG